MSDKEKDINLDEEEILEEDENDIDNPDIDPELTKIDQSILDEHEDGEYDKVQPINLATEMEKSL